MWWGIKTVEPANRPNGIPIKLNRITMIDHKELETKQNHQHGGSPLQDFIRLGMTPMPVKDFSVNINPLGPPRQVAEAWNELGSAIASYPSVDGDGVRRFYEERFGIPLESVLPGNGSIELIYLVPRALGIKRVLIYAPCFHDYTRAATIAGAESVSVPFDLETDFGTPQLEIVEENLKKVDALCIGNPNNPTGTVISREDLVYFAEKYPDKWILVDEAFVQFLENTEQTSLLHPNFLYRNLLVFHSLTKFYALPGLRLGAAVAHPDTIAQLSEFKEPWTVNGIAEQTARVLADCAEYETESVKLVQSERRRIFAKLNNLSCIRTVMPTANFFLSQWTGTDSLDDLLRELLSKGIYIRDCRNFPGLKKNYFRFGMRMPEENDIFINTLVRFAGDEDG